MPCPRHSRLLVPSILALGLPLGMAAQAVEGPDQPGAGTRAGATAGAVVDNVLNSIKWGAYGELHYNNFQTDRTGNNYKDRLELHRFVLLAEAQLHERIRFIGELEFEHGYVQSGQGEVEVEQAYLDFRVHDEHSIQAGILLVPISIGNLYHEPTVFHGVERPEIDRVIVPTTWFEAGIGASGRILPGLEYAVAVQAGLDAGGAGNPANENTTFSAGTALRGARQKGFESDAEDLMYCARLDYRPLNSLWLAGAVAFGESDQGADFDSSWLLYTLEARYAAHGVELGATWAQGFIENPTELPNYNAATQPIPETFEGLSVFAAYDVLRLFTTSEQQVFVFARYEIIDTQAEIDEAATRNPALERTIIQYGVTYKPTPSVAIKADYRDQEDDGATSATVADSWSLGVGFAF